MTKNKSKADEDKELAAAVKQGDRNALSTLYDKYAPTLLGMISRIVTKDSDAEEILQTSFLHAWNHSDDFLVTKRSFFTWLLHIARCQSLEKVKLESVKNPGNKNFVSTGADNNTAKKSNSGSVQQLIFDLLYYQGLSCAAVSEQLAIPVEDIRKNIRMALKNGSGIKA